MFALRAQADRMSAFHFWPRSVNSVSLLPRRQFLPQLSRSIFAQLLLDPLVFQRQRHMLPSFIKTLQHVICFGPARAATGGSFDHLQTGFGLGPARGALLLERIQTRPIAGQLFNQNVRIRRVQLSRAADASFNQQQVPARARC